MINVVNIFLGIIERGLLFSIIVVAIYISSRVIKFDDLTTEGSFGLGGAVMAFSLVHHLPIWLSFLLVLISGLSAGALTGLLHTHLKVNNLISGIVVTTGLFSISLALSGANQVLHNTLTIFDIVPSIFGISSQIITLLALSCSLIAGVSWFLKTEIGFLLFAVGENPNMLTLLKKNNKAYTILGLAIANSFTALSGALFVHYVGYFSIWSGVGILIISLAGLILSETVGRGFGFHLLLGAIFYQIIIAITFAININQDWNKFVSALLIVLLLVLKKKSENNHVGT